MTTANSFTITDKEQRILTLASRGETRGGNNYDAVIDDNDTYKGILTSMTLTQVRDLQLRELPSTGAVGRYQLIRKYYPAFVGDARYAGFSSDQQSRLKFSSDIQDYIILKIMKADYKLDQWLAGSISSEDFQFQMARLFASVPVPRDMQGHNRFVKKGESYYAGDGLNAAKGSSDSFLQELEAIGQGVNRPSKVVDTSPSSINGADPKEGVSNKRIAEYATAGGNRPTGGHRTISDPNRPYTLPTPGNVYEDEPIDFHDNRYDFRTGKMIRDIGINGTAPVSSNTQYTDRAVQSPGVAAGLDAGEVPTPKPALSPAQQSYSAGNSPITDPKNPSFYDPRNGNVVPPPVSAPTGTTKGKSSLPSSNPNRTGPQ